MSLHRSATRKTASGPARRKKDYSIVQQGILELYPLDKPVQPDIDIVFVPGLGANPEECWKSETTKFNWTTEGLVRDFPRARVLLYMYESAWTGPLKVKQFMSNVAMALLVGLRSKREGCQRRPIVFIGHSMGGLVIAKAITIADSRRDKFPIMFEAIAASVFFGTPFDGAPVASVAAMYKNLAEKVGSATSSKLLDLMKPGDEGLRELKHEFMRLVGKLSPKIELMCFYEEQPTDFSKFAGLPSLFGLTKLAIPKEYAEFVSRDSATLPGVEELGLASDHRNLVKFDGPKDERWSQLVRDPLKKIIHGAQLAVKNRLNSVRDIDRGMISGIMDALDGAQVQKKRRTLAQTFAPSSWITKEQEYIQWLSQPKKDAEDESEPSRSGDCLWIRGPEGRGKTSASMAAIEEIENLIKINEEENTGQDPILLAYFFCDSTPDYCTAEDLLKSLVRQLINQQETLAPYAKLFAKKKSKDETSKSQAQVTVENLWQTLQDMLTDEFIGSKVIFVLNNLHALPEDSDSTIKLMKYINVEMQNMDSTDTRRVPTRWFITSREAHNIGEALKVDGIRLVDLNDEKYGDQVQMALRKHAKDKVTSLGQGKNYNKALAYFASSLMGKRAQNTQWIDITCVQLEELPQGEGDLRVRQILETMPQNLSALLNNSWLQVFRSNEKDAEKIKEILRSLVLTYEDPTESELGVLTGLCSNEEEKAELHGLLEKCKPLLSVKRISKPDATVCFINIVVKNHLLENAKQLLGMSDEEVKWQHGVLALRCFSHIKTSFDFPEAEIKPAEDADGDANNSAEDNDKDGDDDEGSEDDDNDDDMSEDDDEDSEDSESEDESEQDADPETDLVQDLATAYAVKNWLRHASKATREIAEDLSLEEDFWIPGARIRRRWLLEYYRMTSTFDDFEIKTLGGLHIAASIGFRQLVAALIHNGYGEEINTHDSLVNTPLHFAAHFGRPKIVEELLNHGAAIDDGDEIGEQTPLHMAAFGGHVEVMKKLVLRGANPNATSNDIGPVVNAAISSGNRAAVELLVEHGVSLAVDRDDVEAPLAQAALLSDVSMFEYLIQKYADKLPAEEYSALVKAAEAGRIEVFNKLLEFEHNQEYFQDALDAAVEEWNWEIVTILLEKRSNLDCNNLFYEAATGTEPQDKLLEVVWQYANGSISAETLDKSLYDATDREKESTVKLLLEQFGANPNATGEEYGNAITAAAYDGTMNIIQLLLNAGADVNAPEGWPLQSAATEGHYEVVQELLSRNVDVNALTTNDHFQAGTALQGACEAGQTEIVRLLLDHGANPNLGGGTDSPPIIAAAMRAEEEILSLLVKAKADLDVFGGWDKSSPLINAAAYMPQSSLQLLLDAGADINLPDNDGDTALIVASTRGDVEAVTFLLDSGADILHSNKDNENALQAAFSNDNEDCLKVLVDRVSVLFGALKTAMDSGNTAVTGVVRSAASSKQGLSYDDELQNSTGEVKQMETPPSDNVEGDQTSVTDESDNDDASSSTSQPDTDTILPPEGQTRVAFAVQEDGVEPEASTLDTVDRLSEELRSALGNQISLLNKLSQDPLEAEDVSTRTPGEPIYQQQQQQRQQPEDYQQHLPPQQWNQENQVAESQPRPEPVELPTQGLGPVKRKPAPGVSYEGLTAKYSQTPSPQPPNASYQPPPLPPTNYNHAPNTYQAGQETTQQFYNTPAPQAEPRYPSPPRPPKQPIAPEPPTQTYQQPTSQSSQAPALVATDYQSQSQSQSQAHYQGNLLYAGAHYRNGSTGGSQQGVESYAVWHPADAYHSTPQGSPPPPPPPQSQPQTQLPQQQQQQQQQQYQAYNPDDQVQVYQAQTYQGQASQYQGYYGGNDNISHQPYNPSAAAANWDQQPRPELKPQRSSFFVGGVKNTFDKAKLNMFNRR
ncbi:hypothetical protein F5X99DRAFT_99738 [Biscogniauxia marginata]|nr:hypothetical protein F5X99DRAFT_99738 [Biscogniauxia marginata]